jgi:hypothetical protein
VRVDDRVHPVPRDIANNLAAFFTGALTAYPDDDLLEPERHYRLATLNWESQWQASHSRVPAAPQCQTMSQRGAEVDSYRGLWRLRADSLHEVRRRNLRLRAFALSLDVTRGALGRACHGWLRSSDRPASASAAWENAAAFVQHDPLRGLPGAGVAGAVDAVPLGFQWRRNGDDDPTVKDVGFSGTWFVGYIRSTRELYAHRSAPHRPEQVWLPAGDVPPEYLPRVRQLHRWAGEPNSLIMLARTAEVAATAFARPEPVDTKR